MSKESTSNLNLPEELEGGRSHLYFYRGACKGPRTKAQIPGTHTGLSRTCCRAAEGKDSGARCRALPWRTACRPGCCSWRDPPCHSSSASSSHNPRSTEQPQAARLGHCTGAPARLFGRLLLVFQNLCQEKMLFLYFCKHLA